MKTSGGRKQTLFVTNCDSPLFERAYFVFRRGAEEETDEDEMIREAQRLAENVLRGKKRRRSSGDVSPLRWFLIGAVSSAILLLLGSAAALFLFAS